MYPRIVCLVPSITELVCDLGLADQLVGQTGFCIHPIAPSDNLELYRQLGDAFGREHEAQALCASFEQAYADATSTARPPREVLYLIWRDPCMSVAPDTYISQTLALVNWRTLPRATDERYPKVDLTSYAGRVDRVLLSCEPFHFQVKPSPRGRQRHRRARVPHRRRDDLVV